MEWTAPLTFSPYALYLKPHNVSAAPLLRLLLNWPENMCDIPGLIIEHLDITSDLQLVLIWCYWSRLIGLLLVLMQFIVSFTISSSVEVVMIKCIFSHFILKQPSGLLSSSLFKPHDVLLYGCSVTLHEQGPAILWKRLSWQVN